MKESLKSDIYMIKKYIGRPLFLILVAVLISSFIKNNPLRGIIILVGSMIPIILISYIERAKIQEPTSVSKYSSKEIVTSKYILSILFILLSVIVFIVTDGINYILYDNFQLLDSINVLKDTLIKSLLLSIVMLPAIFKFGFKRGILIGGIVAIIYIKSNIVTIELNNITEALALVLAFIISYIISIKINEKKEI